jgi:hypothetical protein
MYVNGKMRPVETIPGMEGDKGEWWRVGDSSMIYLIHCKNFCTPQCTPTQHKKKKCFKKVENNNKSIICIFG